MDKSEERPSVGVVVPLANEEETIDAFLFRVLAQLEAQDGVIGVIDTTSQDATLERMTTYARERDARVIVVWAPENRCIVDAYFRGYREALARGFDWILEIDGGFSHCPEEIPRILAAMEQGVDFAAGSRFIRGGKHTGSFFRYVVSFGGTLLTNALLGTRMRDMTSGFECFTRQALSHVLSRGVQSRAHFFQTEIRFMLHAWSWVEVPITYREPSKRIGGATIREALRVLWLLYRKTRVRTDAPAGVDREAS